MGSIFLLLSSFISGLATLELTQIVLPWPVRAVFATVLGLIINTLAIFLVSLFVKFNLISVLVTIFLISLPSLIYLIKKSSFQNIIEDNLDIKKNWQIILGFSIITIFLILIFSKSIFVNSSGIIAGNRLVWTDWPVHIAIITSFVKGDNFPPQNPLYAGQLISYPFLSNFLSSVLQILGASLKTSLVLPGILLGLSAITTVYFLGILLTAQKQMAITGLLIGVFWGGLGFLYYAVDLLSSPNFIETLKFPPIEYTFYHLKNLWFFSFLYSELLPQRAFLFGLPMFFMALILLILGLSHHKKTYLLVAGYLVGIMPFFHMHSYLSFLLFSVIFIPLAQVTSLKKNGQTSTKRQLIYVIIYFALPIIGLGLIQLPFLLSINLNQTFGFNWGWMKEQENFFLFWFKNTGFFWPLWLFAIFKTKLNQLVKNVAIASAILFILPNIFRFAPWPYDNLKIMTYWYLIGAFLVAIALVEIYKKGLSGKILAIALFISLTASGAIEVFRIFNTPKTQIPLWSSKDIELSNSIIKNTEAESVILTAAVHDHPVTALAGRKIIIGFPGNAWSWGLADWSQREADVRTILKGDAIYAPYLLAKYKVNYVLISPRERYFEPGLNEQYFQEKFTFVIGDSDYKLFKVP
ncbi:hypothetical protein HYU92_03185 [Candidatus Curtissbacteria bacterium]|nr:hypothetical protein [Candidatus Curtissbacteria bacterium]